MNDGVLILEQNSNHLDLDEYSNVQSSLSIDTDSVNVIAINEEMRSNLDSYTKLCSNDHECLTFSRGISDL